LTGLIDIDLRLRGLQAQLRECATDEAKDEARRLFRLLQEEREFEAALAGMLIRGHKRGVRAAR